MGEDSDGDANLLEEDSDPQPGLSEEADEPTAEADPGTDGSDPDSPDADESDTDAVAESSASPPGETAEDGGNPSPAETPTVEPEADEETGDQETEADEEADDEPEEETDGEGTVAETGADTDEGSAEKADDGSVEETEDGSADDTDESAEGDGQPGNLQPAERPDVSLDPDQLDPDQEPTPADPEGPDRPAEPPERPDPPERPEVHRPPEEAEPPEDESAPMAEDVARADSFEEAAQRSEPLEDEEMPLADHIEEMLKRLAVVIVIAGVVSLAVLPFSETLINFLWNSILPAGESTRPRLYGPLSLVFTKLKVASLAGLVIALPVFVYETYQFMRPGLYPHERRYYLAAIPTSLVLAFVGISFAYFLVLPVIFTYFLYYSEDVTTIAFALTKTFNLILLLMGYLAIVFQIPLFIMLAIMMGLTTRRWLVDRRLYFWGAFLGIAFLFSPDPTGMAPIMVATTMVALFEGTLFLLKWTGR
jgi:sec-independent protein translocase protein TatC